MPLSTNFAAELAVRVHEELTTLMRKRCEALKPPASVAVTWMFTQFVAVVRVPAITPLALLMLQVPQG